MDLARKALMRIDELEQRLRSTRTPRMASTGFSQHPGHPLRAGNPYRVTRLTGAGRQTLVVKISAVVQALGNVVLVIDGQRAAITSFTSTGSHEKVMLFSARLTEDSPLALQAENGFVGVLDSVEMVLLGEGAQLEHRAGGFNAVESAGALGVITNNNNSITLHRNGEQLNLGFGSACDIAPDYQGGFFVAFADDSQNMWLLSIKADGTQTLLNLASLKSISSVAIHSTREEIIVAYVENGHIFYSFVSRATNSFTRPLMISDEAAVQQIAFVKNCQEIALVINRGKRIFVRLGTHFAKASPKIKVEVTAKITAAIL